MKNNRRKASIMDSWILRVLEHAGIRVQRTGSEWGIDAPMQYQIAIGVLRVAMHELSSEGKLPSVKKMLKDSSLKEFVGESLCNDAKDTELILEQTSDAVVIHCARTRVDETFANLIKAIENGHMYLAADADGP